MNKKNRFEKIMKLYSPYIKFVNAFTCAQERPKDLFPLLKTPTDMGGSINGQMLINAIITIVVFINLSSDFRLTFPYRRANTNVNP
uniref:Uncharacterized protein n=1 Tax=Glossina pallidipes TaxID=7398 RepID=A0A1B0A4A6_GLOPL